MVSFIGAQAASPAANAAHGPVIFGAVLAVFVVLLSIATFTMRCYRKCQPNLMMVIYGRLGSGKSSRCIAGGGAFVIPMLQNYAFIDLTPRTIEVTTNQLKTRDGQRVDVRVSSVVAVSNKPDLMPRAAERLLGLNEMEIIDLLQTMVRESARKVIALSTLEEVQGEADSFGQRARAGLSSDLAAIGVQIFELSVTADADATNDGNRSRPPRAV